MKNISFYCPVPNAALTYATNFLSPKGYTFYNAPDPQVTHLLLPIPSFSPDGGIKGGGSLETVLSLLPKEITVIGGNLAHPALSGYKTIDLLQDPVYLAKNAAITAHCAIQILASCLPCTLDGCPILVIGWGRIGKLLAHLLKANGASVTVSARKETDRAMLLAMGYSVQDLPDPSGFRAVCNTAPARVLPDCPDTLLKIELSSVLGIGGKDVIWARGLPAIHAPESSGALIAETLIRLLTQKEGFL